MDAEQPAFVAESNNVAKYKVGTQVALWLFGVGDGSHDGWWVEATIAYDGTGTGRGAIHLVEHCPTLPADEALRGGRPLWRALAAAATGSRRLHARTSSGGLPIDRPGN